MLQQATGESVEGLEVRELYLWAQSVKRGSPARVQAANSLA